MVVAPAGFDSFYDEPRASFVTVRAVNPEFGPIWPCDNYGDFEQLIYWRREASA